MMKSATTGVSRYNEGENVLLLGMVFAHKAVEPKRGQEFRDRVRCEAVQKLGFNVLSLDDKHDDDGIDEHCRANFANKRRMLKAMRSKWTSMPSLHHVVLDYFFSPVSYSFHINTSVILQCIFILIDRLGPLSLE
jgi:hypothetical protein